MQHLICSTSKTTRYYKDSRTQAVRHYSVLLLPVTGWFFQQPCHFTKQPLPSAWLPQGLNPVWTIKICSLRVTSVRKDCMGWAILQSCSKEKCRWNRQFFFSVISVKITTELKKHVSFTSVQKRTKNENYDDTFVEINTERGSEAEACLFTSLQWKNDDKRWARLYPSYKVEWMQSTADIS